MKVYNRLIQSRRTSNRLDVTFLTAIGVITSALLTIIV